MSLATRSRFDAFLLGDTVLPAEPATGTPTNVRAEAGLFSSANLLFEYEGDNPEDVRFVGYLDGEPFAAVAAGDGEMHMPTLSAEEHTIEIVTQRTIFEGVPDVAGNVDGRRAILRWAAVTAADVRSYRLYANDGAGGAVYTALATVSTIKPDTTFRAAVTSGTGTGTLTVAGSYSGAAMNALWRILIGAGATTFQVDPGTGTYGTAQTFSVGVPFNIGGGLTACFNDAAALYVAADRWDFRLGPARQYVTDELTPGTYLVKVSALDAAGNESTLSSASTISIDPAPRAPTALAVTYSGGVFTATFTNPADVDLARLGLFTNWSVDFAALEDAVIFDYPVATSATLTASAANTINFTPTATPNGTWRFTVRAKDTENRESQNADFVEVVLPASSVGIGVPFAVVVTPGAAGIFVVEWQYDWSEGTAEFWDIYINTSSSSPVFVSPLASVAAAANSGVVAYSYTTGGYADAAVRYFTVRARNATTSLASINTDLTAGTADATAPSAPTGLEGFAE